MKELAVKFVIGGAVDKSVPASLRAVQKRTMTLGQTLAAQSRPVQRQLDLPV